MASAKQLKIYTSLRAGSGLLPAAILSTFFDRTIAGDTSDPISYSEFQSAGNSTHAEVVTAMKQLAEVGRINQPSKGDWSNFDSFCITGFKFELAEFQGLLTESDTPEERGEDAATINDLPYKCTVVIDVEDRRKKTHFLNVWRCGDDGEKITHVIQGMEFPDKASAWRHWRNYVAFLGWPRPATKWASGLAADRSYVSSFGEVREVVYVADDLWNMLVDELPNQLIEDADPEKLELGILQTESRDYVKVPLMGREPARALLGENDEEAGASE